MKTWIKRTLIALVGAAVLAGGIAACGHRDHHQRLGQISAEDAAQWRGKLLERATRELELDTAQQARLGSVFDKLMEQRKALVGSTPDPRTEVRALVAGTTFDRERALALVTEKTEALRSRSPEVIAAAADFYDSLNAGQQAKVRAFMDKRRGWRGGQG
jgi:Spy/CpxP family protein refolding chaperone